MANNNNLAGSAAGAAAAGAAAVTNALMPGETRPAEKNLQTFYSTILKADPVIFGHQFYITFDRYEEHY